MKPYTYLIGWSNNQRYYYGVRYATKSKCLYENGCHPDDLWVTYFGSSKIVDSCRAKHGEPDIVTVRRVFDSVDAARLWESKVIRRLRAVKRRDFLNLTDNISPDCINAKPRSIPAVGRPKGCVSVIKGKRAAHIPNKSKVKYFNEGDILPCGFVWGGQPKTKEHNTKNSLSNKGRHHSDKTREEWSKVRRGGLHAGINNGRARKCKIKGIVFGTVKEACFHFNVTRPTIVNWINSKKHGCQYL